MKRQEQWCGGALVVDPERVLSSHVCVVDWPGVVVFTGLEVCGDYEQ